MILRVTNHDFSAAFSIRIRFDVLKSTKLRKCENFQFFFHFSTVEDLSDIISIRMRIREFCYFCASILEIYKSNLDTIQIG